MSVLIMNRNQAKEILPIIQALEDGRTIQFAATDKEWIDLDSNDGGVFLETLINSPQSYRIKPEIKYRPFKDSEECWQEMQKHQPFGWVKDRDGDKTFIGGINSDNTIFMCNSEILYLKDAFEDFTFIDGTPFGVKVEE